MPQLSTDPWFMTLLCSWLTLLIFSPIKLLPYSLPNNPSSSSLYSKTRTWNWTW